MKKTKTTGIKTKLMRIKKRSVALLLAMAIIITIFPFLAIQTAKADYDVVTDHFQEVFEYAKSLNVNGNYAHSYLVGTALNEKLNKSFVLNNTVFNTSSTKTLREQVQTQISGLEEVSMSVANHPTNDGIYYLVTSDSDSMIGFLFNGYILYNSSSYSGPRYCECSSTYLGSLSFNKGYKLITTQTVITDTPADLGDEFAAYINVVGLDGYDQQRAKTLYRSGVVETTDEDGHTDHFSNVRVELPNYTDKRQVWYFKRYTDNQYYIYNKIDGSPDCYLNIADGIAQSGQNVQVTDWLTNHNAPGDTASLWELCTRSDLDIGKTTYYIRSVRNSNMVLNVDGGGTNVMLGDKSSDTGNNEAFFIYKINEVYDNALASISCILNSNTCMGLEAVSEGTSTNVAYRTYKPAAPNVNTEQTWRFERTNGSEYPPTYRIKHEGTGKYLTVDVGTNEAGKTDNIIIADRNNDDASNSNQKWLLLGNDITATNIVPVCYSNRKYSYYFKYDGTNFVSRGDVVLNIDTPNAETATGKNIQVGQNNFENAQKFKIQYERYAVDKGDFYSPIISEAKQNNQQYAISLSYDGSNNYEANRIQVRRVSDSPAVDQMWYFESKGDGTYIIHNMANGYILDVPGGDVTEGKQALQAYFDNNGSDAQRWYLVQEANGNYSLSPQKDFNLVIDIPDCNVVNPPLENNSELKLYGADSSCDTIFHNKRWTLTVDTKDSPAWGENLGDTFWAYISPTSDSSRYMHCGDKRGDTITCEKADDSSKKKQENYWKFERKADGSYKISSCNLADSGLDRDNNKFGTDWQLIVWESNNGLAQRWFIRKYNDGYHIETKLDGKVLTLQEDFSIKSVTPDSTNTSQLFNIIKTDLSINSDMPNIKMRLFNYGRAINSANDRVLPFFNGARDKSSYIDTDESAERYESGDISPTMKKTLVNGYPYVANNKKDEWIGDGADAARSKYTNTSGSLKYLFDDTMGADTNGFVKGNGSAESYNLSRGDSNYVADSNYQSQCFMINNPSALFQKNQKNGLYYYDSLLNAASFERDSDSSNTGNFKLYDYTMSVPDAGYPYRLASYYSDKNPDYATSITGISVFNGNFYPFNIAHEEGVLSYGDLTDRQKVSNSTDTNGYYVTNGEYAPVNYSLTSSAPIDCWFGMTLECDFEQTSDGTYNGKDVQFNFDGDDDVWVYIDGVLVLDIGGTHGAREGTINFATGTVTDPTGTTTLRALYDAAKNDTETVDGQTVITDQFIEDNFGKSGTTFLKDTKHKLNFYYMERGGVVSSAKINFNLPKGTPSVTKKVDYSNPDFTDKRDYKFKIQQAIPDGNGGYTYQNFSDVTYLLESDDGTSVDGNVLSSDGIFTLKAGQTAYFHNIDDGTQFIVTELYDLGISKTTAQYTKSYIDSSGNRTIVDDKGNRVAVDDNGDVVTDENGYVVKVDSNGKLMTDESGKYQNYGYKLEEFTDTKDRVVGPYTLETNVEQNITFTNTLQTTSLDVSEKVYVYNNDTDNWDEVSSVPGAVYNFGLLLYAENDDGTIEEYGHKYFSIPGDDLAQGLLIDKLPVGVLYKLWEYNPVDDESHRYVPPEFNDLNSGKSVVGSFVKAGGTAEDSDGISGEVVGEIVHVKVTNKYALRKNVVFVKSDDKQSVDVGETVNYTITSEVPDTTGFTDYTYLITDTMSGGLTFNKNVKVTIGSKDATSACTITYDVDGNANKFTVSVPVMNYSFGAAITVTYSAVVNTNAAAKIENNSATLTYSNAADSTITTKSSETQVYSAKIVIDKYKTGDTSTKLSGAEFYLYKRDGSAKKYYKSDANGVTWVDVKASATKKTTDSNGAASFDGVADGTYYLEEVKAPAGYNLLTEDPSVVINGGGDNPVAANLSVTKSIDNKADTLLPTAGGRGAAIFFILSGAIFACCLILLIVKRKCLTRKS